MMTSLLRYAASSVMVATPLTVELRKVGLVVCMEGGGGCPEEIPEKVQMLVRRTDSFVRDSPQPIHPGTQQTKAQVTCGISQLHLGQNNCLNNRAGLRATDSKTHVKNIWKAASSCLISVNVCINLRSAQWGLLNSALDSLTVTRTTTAFGRKKHNFSQTLRFASDQVDCG